MIGGILLGSMIFLALAYLLYGRYQERFLCQRLPEELPSVALKDDLDYFPLSLGDLFCEHLSGLGGIGAVLGAIWAGAMYGWLPALLWLLFGGVFIGGVHDLSIMALSLKYDGLPLYEIIRRRTKGILHRTLLGFFWLAEVLLLTCFLDLSAKIMVASPGAACFTVALLSTALIIGILSFAFRLSVSVLTLIAVPVLVGFSALLALVPSVYGFFINDLNTWRALLVGFLYLGSIMPGWLWVKPVQGLVGRFTVIGILAALAGIFLLGWNDGLVSSWPVYQMGNRVQEYADFWPLLFLTITCGAVSGFHAMVSTTITTKEMASQRHLLPIGYGAMLLETLLGVVALCLVLLGGTPQQDFLGCFVLGLTKVLSGLGLPSVYGEICSYAFINLLAVTAALSALVIMRNQALEFSNNRISSYVASAIGILMPIIIIAVLSKMSEIWLLLWILFGAANLQAAAVSMLYVNMWLRIEEGKFYKCFVMPTAFLFVIALGGMCWVLVYSPYWLLKVMAIIFIVLVGRVLLFFYFNTKLAVVKK